MTRPKVEQSAIGWYASTHGLRLSLQSRQDTICYLNKAGNTVTVAAHEVFSEYGEHRKSEKREQRRQREEAKYRTAGGLRYRSKVA